MEEGFTRDKNGDIITKDGKTLTELLAELRGEKPKEKKASETETSSKGLFMPDHRSEHDHQFETTAHLPRFMSLDIEAIRLSDEKGKDIKNKHSSIKVERTDDSDMDEKNSSDDNWVDWGDENVFEISDIIHKK